MQRWSLRTDHGTYNDSMPDPQIQRKYHSDTLCRSWHNCLAQPPKYKITVSVLYLHQPYERRKAAFSKNRAPVRLSKKSYLVLFKMSAITLLCIPINHNPSHSSLCPVPPPSRHLPLFQSSQRTIFFLPKCKTQHLRLLLLRPYNKSFTHLLWPVYRENSLAIWLLWLES